MARLKEALNLRKLIQDGSDGCEFQLDTNFVNENAPSSDEDNPPDLVERKFENSNKECVGVFDEDTYEEGEPFELIARKMSNLVPDGKIKKRVIREGDGEKPLEHATVKIHYNGYLEYEEQPFDSTYIRKRPHKFKINTGEVIAGLDFGVQSMKLNEKSQFLIDADYAYGKNVLIGRIPANATVLFEVELLEIVNSGAIITHEQLPEEEQKMFPEVYKYCTALSERGKSLFMTRQYSKAIKDYNTAVAELEKVVLRGKEEIEKHQELTLKLLSNLLICYVRTGEPRKGCTNAKKIYSITENGELLKIPAKVFFNHAKCLRILGEYDEAKTILDKAYKMEPKNPEIANEMLNLERDKVDHRKKQEVFAKALVGDKNQ